MLGLWLVIGAVLAQTPAPAGPPAQEEAADFRGFVDQARFFLRREWYADAAGQLERAVATPDGRLDPEAWFLLAKVRYELADLDGARQAADRALVHSRTPEQTEQAHELLRWLTDQFGYVELVPPRPGMTALVDVQLQSVLFDPQLKLYFNKLLDRLERPLTLPGTLGLPTGTYTIQGQAVEVQAGERITLHPRVGGGLQDLELEVGLGITAWWGPATEHLLPAPTVAVALSLPLTPAPQGAPIGPLVAGVLAEWSPQPARSVDGSLFSSLSAWSAGARLGVELGATKPLVIRPSLGWRYVQLPGVELACDAADSGFTCQAGDAPVRRLYVYGTGTAHAPFAELAFLYLDRSRPSGLGGGVKLSGERAFGAVATGEAQARDGTRYAWTAEGGWQAWGLRVLADLSYAF